MVVAAVSVGLAGAAGAVLFRLMIRTVQAVAFGGADGLSDLASEGIFAEAHDPLAQTMELEWYWRLAIPATGGLIVGPLIYFFAREARGHGVPEVMKAVALRGGHPLSGSSAKPSSASRHCSVSLSAVRSIFWSGDIGWRPSPVLNPRKRIAARKPSGNSAE